eukprot:3835759-Pleurochrysis_carterae.AAC.8
MVLLILPVSATSILLSSDIEIMDSRPWSLRAVTECDSTRPEPAALCYLRAKTKRSRHRLWRRLARPGLAHLHANGPPSKRMHAQMIVMAERTCALKAVCVTASINTGDDPSPAFLNQVTEWS